MPDFKDEIWKIEEISRSVSEKCKEISDIDQMSLSQHLQQTIHVAYADLQKLNKS